MIFVVSRYNQDVEWLKEYTDNPIIYDRSEEQLENAVKVENIGTDIADKFKFIINNYENLPEVAVYTKANLFKYITKEEFDEVKYNKAFTPLLTKNHQEKPGVSFYKDGIYWEINNYWYLGAHPVLYPERVEMVSETIGIDKMEFVPFAPGSNYILPRENILKHSKKFYELLRSYLEWDRYPGEAQIMERGLYTLWNIQDYQKQN